jgi:thiol-disulfide isomerase/thioredoxin
MGKATRLKRESARERIATQRAAARRAEVRRRAFVIIGSIVAVVAVIGVLIGIKISTSSGSPAKAGSPTGVALPASVSKNVTSVPATTLNAIGAGSVGQNITQTIKPITGAALTSGGKPEMLYIGAEFCPYCAAMRWSMAVALSRFGTLSTPLHGIHSAGGQEAYPNTATLTFYKTSYTSKYLTFTPVENEKVDHSPLQQVNAQQKALWQKYNANSYPFIDVGGKYAVGVIYNPQVLAGQSWSQIASAMHNPSSPVAKAVNGSANYLTAAICKTTNNTPASVCSSSMIKSLQGKL